MEMMTNIQYNRNSNKEDRQSSLIKQDQAEVCINSVNRSSPIFTESTDRFFLTKHSAYVLFKHWTRSWGPHKKKKLNSFLTSLDYFFIVFLYKQILL